MHNMKSLKQLTLYQFRGMLRNKVAFFFNLVLPVLLLSVFGSILSNTGTSRVAEVGLVDRDGGVVTETLRQMVAQSDLYKLVPGNEADLREQLIKGKVQAVLILPEGLSQRPEAGQVTILYDAGSQASGSSVVGLQVLISSVDAAIQGTVPHLISEAQAVETGSAMEIFDFLMPGQLVYMLLSAGLMTVAISVAAQRHGGELRHMLSTPVSIGVWMAARFLSNLVLTVIQAALLFSVAYLLFDVRPPTDVAGTVVVVLLSMLVALGLGMTVAVFAKGAEAALAISMVLYMALTFLGNAMMPLDGAPAVVQYLTKLMPSSYMTSSLRLVMMQAKGLGAAATDLAILALCAAVFLGISSWRMRKQFTAA